MLKTILPTFLGEKVPLGFRFLVLLLSGMSFRLWITLLSALTASDTKTQFRATYKFSLPPSFYTIASSKVSKCLYLMEVNWFIDFEGNLIFVLQELFLKLCKLTIKENTSYNFKFYFLWYSAYISLLFSIIGMSV